MPELPEVETSRRRVERVLKGKRLVEVLPDPDDRIVYDLSSTFRTRPLGGRIGRKPETFGKLPNRFS